MSEYRFFKYRAIDKHFIDSLVKGTLYFSRPEKLNDPFDCQVDIRKSILNGMESLDSVNINFLNKLVRIQSLLDKLQSEMKNVGICSFSLLDLNELNSTLLWSHYANEHKGACVSYEFPISFLDDGESFVGSPNVTYEWDALTDWFSSINNRKPMEFDEFVKELAKKMWTVKSPPWKYEKEARIIRKKAGAFRIPRSFIKQICFGLNTPQEDIELIRKIADGFEHEVTFCKVEKTGNDFGTEIKEI